MIVHENNEQDCLNRLNFAIRGGGNCLFGTESVYRGKYSIVEVASDAVKTELPDMGIWESGTLNVGTRCFDLLCTGKCDLTMSSLKLNIESSNKIPNFFTKNGDGKIVFSNPAPMSVITTPKGHGTWIQIELKTINGVSTDSLSDIAKHVCLGIKKRSEIDYFDVIHAGKLTSEYVDLFDTDAVELVPLLSKTEVTSNSYEIVKPGEEITPSDFGLTGTSFDFGSVYRVNIKDCGAWIERECNLSTLDTEGYWGYRQLSVGPISGQKGDQLVVASSYGALACSSDGMSWFKIRNDCYGANVTPIAYGNGIWSLTNDAKVMQRSIDEGKTWEIVSGGMYATPLAFGNNIFMLNDYKRHSIGEDYFYNIYTSTDANTWTKVGIIPALSYSSGTSNCYTYYTFFIYGNGKWISGANKVFQSKNGREWEYIGQISTGNDGSGFYGNCYVNGYFYLAGEGKIMRSATGEKWEKFAEVPRNYESITYYKNKLYLISLSKNTCYIGIPNP